MAKFKPKWIDLNADFVFTGDIEVPTPTTGQQAANKDYIDTLIDGTNFGGFKATELVYVDDFDKVIQIPSPFMPDVSSDILREDIVVMPISGSVLDYGVDYTVRSAGSDIFICLATDSTAPVDPFDGGDPSNPSVGCTDFLLVGDTVKVMFPDGIVPRGFQGVVGPEGVVGPQGLDGFDIGLTGPQGYAGPQGIIGAGFQGSTGTSGSMGVQGFVGSTGLTGSQGSTGAGFQGSTGAQGFTGVQGITGTNGTNGFQGSIGNNGTQGITGTNGTNGFQGSTGTQGSSGFQGFQGGVAIDYMESYSGANTSFPSSTNFADATSLTLPAGDWEIIGTFLTNNGGASPFNYVQIGINTTNGNNTTGMSSGKDLLTWGPPATFGSSGAFVRKRVTPSTSTIYYLKAGGSYAGGAPTYTYYMTARRLG